MGKNEPVLNREPKTAMKTEIRFRAAAGAAGEIFRPAGSPAERCHARRAAS